VSTVKSKKLQVGTDATATNNFTIYQPSTPDGTLRIGVGNADSPTEVGQFNSNGYVPTNAPAFLAVSGANQSVTSGAITKVSINTEQFDTNSNYDTSTYRFTPTVAGYYQVSGMVKILGSLTASQVIIYKNGAIVVSGNYFIVGAQAALFNTVEGLIYMNGSSDYLELFGYVVGTSPVFTYTNIYNTSRFSAFLARAA
tara:strand:- start:86 stop:679 length:594 start_codon:yes stop_codon:yes gene_type:complete